MGYRIKAVPLELPGYQEEANPEDNLVVYAVLPTIKEGAIITSGRIQIADEDAEGGFREETSAEFQRRAFGLMVGKLRSWTLEDEDGRPIPVPRDVHPGTGPEALSAQLDHLYEQDENAVLAIWQAWRVAGLPKKPESAEGKDSAAPSTPGPGASPRHDGGSDSSQPSMEDLRWLESQIPQ